jgi:Predicted nucleotide-binding protein containing TIR-like domain
MIDGRIAIFISCSEKYRKPIADKFRDAIDGIGMTAIVLSEVPKLAKSWTPEEKLDEYLKRCEGMIVLATPDDRTADGRWIVRGNIADEAGRARTLGHLRDRMAVFKAPEVVRPAMWTRCMSILTSTTCGLAYGVGEPITRLGFHNCWSVSGE